MRPLKQASLWVILSAWLGGWAGFVPAHAAELPHHWVRSDQKTVDFAPSAVLEVTLSHIGDSEAWEQLRVEISYPSSAIQEQIAGLRSRYPGHQVHRVIVNKDSDFKLQIPALNVSQSFRGLQAQEGPYFRYEALLNRDESQKLRKSMKDDPSWIQVSAQIVADVPKLRVIEEIEVSFDTCSLLLPTDGSVYDLLKGVTKLQQHLAGMRLKHESTRESLRRSVFESCVDFKSDTGVESFKELLTLPVTPNRQARPRGETRMVTPGPEPLALQYAVQVQEYGGNPGRNRR